MKLLAQTLLNSKTGVIYISVKDLIHFLDNLKAEETREDAKKLIEELIVSFSTMKSEVEYH